MVRYTQNQRWERARRNRQATDGWFRVEAIRGREVRGDDLWYLVKWQGYSENDNTWEPKRYLANARELIEEYDRLHPPSGGPLLR